MDSDFDPQREAEAVMKLAAGAEGPERQRFIGLAVGWLELARGRSFHTAFVTAVDSADWSSDTASSAAAYGGSRP